MVTKIDRMKNTLVLHNHEEKEIEKKKNSFRLFLPIFSFVLLSMSKKTFPDLSRNRKSP